MYLRPKNRLSPPLSNYQARLIQRLQEIQQKSDILCMGTREEQEQILEEARHYKPNMGQIGAFAEGSWRIEYSSWMRDRAVAILLPLPPPYSCTFHREVERVSRQKKPHMIEVFTLLVQVSLQSMKVSAQKRSPPDKTEL